MTTITTETTSVPLKTQAAPVFRHLRLAKSSLFSQYLLFRPQLLHTWQWVKPRRARPKTGHPTDHVVYHSWLPGMLEVPKAAADLIQELMFGKANLDTSPRHRQVATVLQDLGWLEDHPVDLDALLVKARDVFPAVQNPSELRELLALVQERRPKVVVEIGTAAGGLLYCLSQLADPTAKIVSIDILGGDYGGGQTTADTLAFATFGPPSQHFHFLRQRSFHLSTRQGLENILAGQTIDFLLIDADHSYAGVKADFEMYGSLVAPDGLIAMHDICEFPLHMKAWREGNDVNVFWKELQEKGYNTQEIVDRELFGLEHENEARMGTRWPALGFGLVFGNADAPSPG